MNIQQAVSSAFSHIFDWKGRASRSAYWLFYLAFVVVYIFALIIDLLIFDYPGLFVAMVVLASFIPYLSVLVRRLHDTGRSGWWFWIQFIPLIGAIWLLILMVLPSEDGPNRYGPNPEGATSEPESV